jgi:kynureninase
MAYNEKAKERTMRYMKENREKITMNIPKGLKDEFKEHARSKSMSLTELFIRLMEEDMKKSPV